MNETAEAKRPTRQSTQRVRLKQPTAFYLAAAIVVVLLAGVWVQRRQNYIPNAAAVREEDDSIIMPASAKPPVKGEEEFILHMIPHHQEAVDNSRYITEHSQNQELVNFGEELIVNQTKEVWTMVGYYQMWFDKQYLGSTTYVKMMPDLTQLSGAELDKAYINGMIDHHKAAVEMAQNLLQITEKEELKGLARQIIDKQTAEITTLEGWAKNYQ